MTKIDIISGFLGAGKTTLINKLIKGAYEGERLVLIENEFGEIGIDGGFLKDSGINITEMNSGCICCSLVGDFSEALGKVIDEYSPDRVIIEPSGVGKLSDVIKAVKNAELEDVALNSFTVVVDVNKCKMYMKNFGEFFGDQIENAGCIIFSHTDNTTETKLEEALALVKAHNESAVFVTTPIAELDAKELIRTMERRNSIEEELAHLMESEELCSVCGHHHHDHDHHEHHHHHDHDECCEHGHHHHHDHDECCEHEHHHHHDHDECCEHGHHHHHHADDVFTSWGRETVKKFSPEDMKEILHALEDEHKYGFIIRAKGIVESTRGCWMHFDYIPGEPDIRCGSASAIGKICVIGSNINEHAIAELFELSE